MENERTLQKEITIEEGKNYGRMNVRERRVLLDSERTIGEGMNMEYERTIGE